MSAERGRPAGDTEALVLAAGRGERLGLGPKAFLALGGRTLLERAAEVMSAVAGRVIVGVAAADVARARALLGVRAEVTAGGETRLDTLRVLLGLARAPLVVVHDVVHPFVTADLARRVLAAAREHGAATAAIAPGEHVFRADGALLRQVRPAASVWVSQKPQAFLRRPIAALLAERTRDPGEGALDLLAEAGVPVAVVRGEPGNIKITTAWDWTLARLVETSGLAVPGAGDGALDPAVSRASGED